MTDDALMPGERHDLRDLRWNWGDAYDVGFDPPSSWTAQRRDNAEVVEAATADRLRAAIRKDYWRHPVGRSAPLADGST